MTEGARILKYSFDVTEPPNVNASATHWGLGAICYLPPPGKLSNPKCQKNVSKKVSQKVSKKSVKNKKWVKERGESRWMQMKADESGRQLMKISGATYMRISIPDICHFFTLIYFEAWKFYKLTAGQTAPLTAPLTARTAGPDGRPGRTARTDGPDGRPRRTARTDGPDGRPRRTAQTDGPPNGPDGRPA